MELFWKTTCVSILCSQSILNIRSIGACDLLVSGRFLSLDVGSVGLPLEDDRAFFEKLLLPLVELHSMDLVLINQRGHGDTIEKMLPCEGNWDLHVR
jgi:hypothetical protein